MSIQCDKERRVAFALESVRFAHAVDLYGVRGFGGSKVPNVLRGLQRNECGSGCVDCSGMNVEAAARIAAGGNVKQDKGFYRELLEMALFEPCEVPDHFPPEGECWRLSSSIGGGYYWYYEAKGRYNIKIHDFWYREDTVFEVSIPECLSITWYESISGEELDPYRKMNCNVIKSYLGGYEPYRALIHRGVPIRSVGIEYQPEYYASLLRERLGEQYQSPTEAFRMLAEVSDFPEMAQLLRQIWRYRGEGATANLYYDAKAAEALSLIFEYYQKKSRKVSYPVSKTDERLLQSVGSYIGDHYADELSIEMLAKIACMGTTKFKRCFKSYFECTVAEYIQKVRIDRAEHLLAYTDLAVGEVARAVGYTAAGHFAGLFSKKKGCLPLEYRKKMRNPLD